MEYHGPVGGKSKLSESVEHSAKRNKGGIPRLSDEWVRIQIGRIDYTCTYGKTGGLSFSHEQRRGVLRVYTYGIKSPKADLLVP